MKSLYFHPMKQQFCTHRSEGLDALTFFFKHVVECPCGLVRCKCANYNIVTSLLCSRHIFFYLIHYKILVGCL